MATSDGRSARDLFTSSTGEQGRERLAGRVLMGLGAGLASSSVTSYIVDAAPTRPAWLASVASSQTARWGLPLAAGSHQQQPNASA